MRDMIKRFFEKHRYFILYALCGVFNSVLDFSVYSLLTAFTNADIGFCHACGYIAGFVSSFILNRHISFNKGCTTVLGQQLWRFFVVNAVSLLISVFFIGWIEDIGINKYLAKIPTQGLIVLNNYLGYKYFVFKVSKTRKERKREDRQ